MCESHGECGMYQVHFSKLTWALSHNAWIMSATFGVPSGGSVVVYGSVRLVFFQPKNIMVKSSIQNHRYSWQYVTSILYYIFHQYFSTYHYELQYHNYSTQYLSNLLLPKSWKWNMVPSNDNYPFNYIQIHLFSTSMILGERACQPAPSKGCQFDPKGWWWWNWHPLRTIWHPNWKVHRGH